MMRRATACLALICALAGASLPASAQLTSDVEAARQQEKEDARERKLAESKLERDRLAEKKLAEKKLERDRLAEKKLAEKTLAEKKLAEKKLERDKLAEKKLAEKKLERDRLAEKKRAEKEADRLADQAKRDRDAAMRIERQAKKEARQEADRIARDKRRAARAPEVRVPPPPPLPPAPLPAPDTRPDITGEAIASSRGQMAVTVDGKQVRLAGVIECNPKNEFTLLKLIAGRELNCEPFGANYRCVFRDDRQDLAELAVRKGVAQPIGEDYENEFYAWKREVEAHAKAQTSKGGPISKFVCVSGK